MQVSNEHLQCFQNTVSFRNVGPTPYNFMYMSFEAMVDEPHCIGTFYAYHIQEFHPLCVV